MEKLHSYGEFYAASALVDYLTSPEVSAKNIASDNLSTVNGNISTLNVTDETVSNLTVENENVSTLYATDESILNLTAENANVSTLNAINSTISNLIADSISVKKISVDNLSIETQNLSIETQNLMVGEVSEVITSIGETNGIIQISSRILDESMVSGLTADLSNISAVESALCLGLCCKVYIGNEPDGCVGYKDLSVIKITKPEYEALQPSSWNP